jgi:transposase
MRKIKEILRLYTELRQSKRQIARSLNLAYSSVHDVLHRAQAAGLTWPLDPEQDDGEVEQRLYQGNQGRPRSRPEPDWPRLDVELRRKGVTLELLWLEYKSAHPEGYQYAQFCVHYRRWRQRIDVVLRQPYRAGEKLFVDYAGQTLPIVDGATGEVRQAQLFVAVLGASNYTYAEAQWAQDLPSWIGGHTRALAFFDGIPEIVVFESQTEIA